MQENQNHFLPFLDETPQQCIKKNTTAFWICKEYKFSPYFLPDKIFRKVSIAQNLDESEYIIQTTRYYREKEEQEKYNKMETTRNVLAVKTNAPSSEGPIDTQDPDDVSCRGKPQLVSECESGDL